MFSSIFNNNRSCDNLSQTSDLEYVINHVFFPVNEPEDKRKDRDRGEAMGLFTHTVCAAVDVYCNYVDDVHKLQWNHIVQMLRSLCHSVQSDSEDIDHLSQLREMQPGGMLSVLLSISCLESIDNCVLPFLYYEAAIIFRKQDHCVLYEPLELNPVVDNGPLEKVIHSYPELSIEIPDEVFHNGQFQSELANFLRCINSRSFDSQWEWYKDITKFRPRYTIQLLSGILRAVGRHAEATQVTKRVVRRVRNRHHVSTLHRERDWQRTWDRSEEWFLVRLVVQSSLDRSPPGRAAYKTFMLFLMLNLANYAAHTSLSSDLLHLMSTKILRRFRKLGTSIPKWLPKVVMETCTHLSDILDSRCIQAQIVQRVSWNPSQLNLSRDIQLSLPCCSEDVSSSPTNHGPLPLVTPVLHCPTRGSLYDFLSLKGGFFEEAYRQDPRVALHDVEQAVEQGIDDWYTYVTDVDETCIQLEALVEKYLSGVQAINGVSVGEFIKPSCEPEQFSITLLTVIELWIALDKQAVKKIPILTDYSPEIPMELFDRVLLRKTANLRRFCRAHQYLSTRHAQSQRSLSTFSQELTEHSFPVRFCARSPHLSHPTPPLKRYAPSACPLYAKVVLFELQCPVSFETWRTTTIRLMDFCDDWKLFRDIENLRLSRHDTEDTFRTPIVQDLRWRHYAVGHRRTVIKPAHSHDKLLWVVFVGNTPRKLVELPKFRNLESLAYKIPSGRYTHSGLQKYLTFTTHTSNQVLSSQTDCHGDLSLHEFIAFGHLRSGGSLQWMNILQEFRNRSLNFHRHEVHLLLAQASAQVGPLSNTGEFVWHRELQDASFCHALLDELENLLVEIRAGSSDGPVMATISILAGLIASGPSEAISERTFQLLRNVREKTFDWVNELLYDVIKSPTNEEHRQVLWDMAAICRSTFDVDPAIMHKLLHSARDIEIALTCAILMRTIVPANFPGRSGPFSAPGHFIDRISSDPKTLSFSRVLLERDHRLAHALEKVLINAIQADTPDSGIDLAVRKSWPGHRPGTRRWKALDPLNSHWIECQTGTTRGQQSQIVHVNLLDGSLLVDGWRIGERLPSAITKDPVYSVIFGDVRAFATLIVSDTGC